MGQSVVVRVDGVTRRELQQFHRVRDRLPGFTDGQQDLDPAEQGVLIFVVLCYQAAPLLQRFLVPAQVVQVLCQQAAQLHIAGDQFQAAA